MNLEKEQFIELLLSADNTIRKANNLLSYNFDKLPEEIKAKLTYFDRAVYDALIKIYVEGNTSMSTSMLYKTIVGNDQARLDENMKLEINKSMLKFMSLIVEINTEYSIEANKYSFKFKKNMVYAKYGEAWLNGQLVEDCYHILKTPLLLEYAQGKNQISRTCINFLIDELENE